MTKLSAPFLLLAVASLTSTSACLPKKHGLLNGGESGAGLAAENLYREAAEARKKNDRLTEKARLKEIIDRHKDSARRADALAELGAMIFQEHGCEAGLAYYQTLHRAYPEHPHAPVAAASINKCGIIEAGGSDLASRFESAASAAERMKVALAAVDQNLATDDYSGAVRWLISALAESEESEAQEKLRAQIIELIDAKISAQEVRGLLEECESTDFPADILSFKLGRILYHVHDFVNAEEILVKATTTWPESSYAKGSKRLLSRIKVRNKVSSATIGVLLPLSGRLKAYGNYVRQAVRLAAGEFDQDPKTKDQPPPINIVFRDTKGDRIHAAKAVEDFVLVDGAIAIIGGLFRVESESAAFKAQEFGVPFLSLSSVPGITEVGPYVFRSGLTNEAQVSGLVNYVMDVLGMQKFAMLYPRHPYGETLLHLFWDKVLEKGGEIRGVESYGSNDTTFTWPVKRLVGRARLSIRRDYKEALKECGKQPDPYRVQRCRRRVKSDLAPIIDFDGLFVPDYPKTLSLIAPALASEDIIVEQNPRRLKRIEKTLGRKVKPVTLLGTNGWNNPILPTKAERYVENAIFTDGFFAKANDKATMKFVADFQKAFQRTPMLQDALFYDATNIMKQLIIKSKPQTRNEMREHLRRVNGFKGVTGITSFRTGQDAQKSMHILMIKNSKIVEAPPAVEDAPTPGGDAEKKTKPQG